MSKLDLFVVKYEDGEVVENLTFEESQALFLEQFRDGRRCTVRFQDTSYKST